MLSIAVYSIGVFCVLVLAPVSLFASGLSFVFDSDFNWTLASPYFFIDPNDRIPVNHIALYGLAFGVFPMILACMAVYKYCVDKSKHKYRKFNLIFLPAYVCIIGMMILVFNIVVGRAMQYF